MESLSTCPILAKSIGKVLTLTSMGTIGTAPYKIEFKRNGVTLPNGTFTNIGEGIVVEYDYTMAAEDAPSVRLSSTVTDSCPEGGKVCNNAGCLINVDTRPTGPYTLIYIAGAIGLIGLGYYVVKRRKLDKLKSDKSAKLNSREVSNDEIANILKSYPDM